MAKYIEIDMSNYADFINRLAAVAKGDFKRELAVFLEGLGMEFLRIVEDEIKRRDVKVSTLLLESFQPGDQNGIWKLDAGDLSVEIGTALEYASYVNDGHWTNKAGQESRFVPGHWEKKGKKDVFIYEPGAKTGMVLKQKWVEGKHYWESALRIMDQMMPEILEAKLQQWLDTYFADFI